MGMTDTATYIIDLIWMRRCKWKLWEIDKTWDNIIPLFKELIQPVNVYGSHETMEYVLCYNSRLITI